jgi:hypothetical protein
LAALGSCSVAPALSVGAAVVNDSDASVAWGSVLVTTVMTMTDGVGVSPDIDGVGVTTDVMSFVEKGLEDAVTTLDESGALDDDG